MHLSLTAVLAAVSLLPLPSTHVGDITAAELPWRSLLRLLREPRTIDGSRNNLQHPTWGSAGSMFRRIARTDYGDGVAYPAGATRPSARAVSNAVVAQQGSRENAAGASDFVWQWGQFLDHDLDLTRSADPTEPFDVLVPQGDPWFDPDNTGAVTIPLVRSRWQMQQGVREQMNALTAWIDASMVYGSDPATARSLRALDGTGRLRTSAGDLLPLNDTGSFLAGDVRVNEQVALTALHTLFVREHNAWADAIRLRSEREVRAALAAGGHGSGWPPQGVPGVTRPLDDDQIYELARAIVGAEIQAVTYREFLPFLLGEDALGVYPGYRPELSPDVANEFATACYRFGHSMLSPVLRRVGPDGATIPAGDLPLHEAFFNPAEVITHGIDPLLRGLASQRAQEIDAQIIDGVRNFLFGAPGAGGFDLAALNLQRGRDHGLASYAMLRRDLGLGQVTSFAQVTSDPLVAAQLASVYGSVDAVNVWVGALAEDHAPGALIGATNRAVLVDQFSALRDGDRFWYELRFDARLVQLVERQTLARIVRRNTQIGAELQDDVFRHEQAGSGS